MTIARPPRLVFVSSMLPPAMDAWEDFQKGSTLEQTHCTFLRAAGKGWCSQRSSHPTGWLVISPFALLFLAAFFAQSSMLAEGTAVAKFEKTHIPGLVPLADQPPQACCEPLLVICFSSPTLPQSFWWELEWDPFFWVAMLFAFVCPSFSPISLSSSLSILFFLLVHLFFLTLLHFIARSQWDTLFVGCFFPIP